MVFDVFAEHFDRRSAARSDEIGRRPQGFRARLQHMRELFPDLPAGYTLEAVYEMRDLHHGRIFDHQVNVVALAVELDQSHVEVRAHALRHDFQAPQHFAVEQRFPVLGHEYDMGMQQRYNAAAPAKIVTFHLHSPLRPITYWFTSTRAERQVEILRASKYRLEPTDEQAAWLAQTAGACRYVWNIGLEQRRDHYRKERLSYPQQCRELTACRAGADWLRAAPVHALQCALWDLDKAYERFFLGLGGYPRPKRRDGADGFRLPDPSYLGFKRLSKRIGAVKLPKIGWIKLRDWRGLGGEMRSMSISKRAGHWYVAIQWRAKIADPAKSTLPPVGIDRGVKVFAALSTGQRIAPLNSFKKIECDLAKLPVRLARKTKFSANWRKLKAEIGRLHAHAANARKDFLHKLSTSIAKSHGLVKVEKLRVKNMTASAKGTLEEPGRNVAQKSGLNRAILDQGWSMFDGMLRYKLPPLGGEHGEVEAAFTSQRCRKCGCTDARNRLSQALFHCISCHHEENADDNASHNILQARTIAVAPPKRTLRKAGKRNHPKETTHAAA